jgi:lysophospholipase L1-like esterase
MPLISRGVPVFASSQIYAASGANDADYSTEWRGAIPGWIALDLSHVPAGQRGQVVLTWYNDPSTSPYDHTVVGEVGYNNLRDYTVQANAAPGGTGAAPASGWVTLATVTGNRLHSRQHALDLTGYNWVRLNVTAGDGSAGNSDASINLDVHNASLGAQDDWIFFGDSITEDGMFHSAWDGSSVGNFSELVNQSKPTYYPLYEDGGIWGLITADGAQRVPGWLNTFPGKYVALAYGTNDANGCGNTTTFYNNYVTMVQAVLAAGKTPVVPTIPWARTANVRNCGPAFNAKIQALYAAFPQIVKGPDFWTFFSNNQTLIGSDNLHPSGAGYAAYRQQWATTMLANVYTSGAPAPAVSLSPGTLAFGSQRVGTAGATQSVSLQNTGNAALTISAIALGGANAGDFNQTSACPLSPATLAAGSSCTVTVGFQPSATGSRAASVSVTDDAPGSPQSVSLSGTGTAPAVTLTPTSLSFGSQLVGTTSAAQSSTLRNSGTAPLALSSIGVTGANASDFSASHNCPASLAVNATCTISVTFAPIALGGRTASVTISDDAPGSPHGLALSGTGSNSAILFDRSLGTKTENVGGTTMKLTTAGAAASRSRVFVFLTWNNGTRTLTSVAGGGLTWTVDVQAKDASNNHGAIASANATSGLASGSTITATFSGSVGHGLMSGASLTGIASTFPLDAAASSVQGGVAGWTAGLTTTNANDLLLGWSSIDTSATSIPTSPAAEIHDFGDQWFNEWSTSVYRIETSAGAKTVSGLWSRATGSSANVTVAAAYKAG